MARVFSKTINAQGVTTYLAVDVSYDEVVQLLVEAGIVPEGMTVGHWRGGMDGLTLEFHRPDPTVRANDG